MGKCEKQCRWWLLGCLMLLPWLSTMAQQTVKGKVMNEKGEPLFSATVTIFADSLCKTMRGYGFTQQDGTFEVKTTATYPLWLRVKYLGQADWTERLEKAEENLEIYMDTDSRSLSEVIVKGKYGGMKVSGDTIQFNTDFFKNGTEQTVADVLRKLPGVNVAEDGSVSYSGEKVDKLLVNGKDLFQKENSGMVINNMAAGLMVGAEILKNYKDQRIDSKYAVKKTTAINIKTSASLKWTGNANAAGGIKDKATVKGAIVGFNELLSGTALLSGNNVGRPLMSFNEYTQHISSMDVDEESGMQILTLTSAESALTSPSERIDKSKGGVMAFGGKYRPNKQMELEGNLFYADNRTHEGEYSEETYFSDGRKVERRSDRENKGRFLSAKFKEYWRLSKRVELKGQTSFNHLWGDNRLTARTTGAENAFIGQYDTDRNWKISQGLTSVIDVGTGVVKAYGEVELKREKEKQLFKTQRIGTTGAPDTWTDVYTERTYEKLRLMAGVDYRHFLGNDYIMKASMRSELRKLSPTYLNSTLGKEDRVSFNDNIASLLFQKKTGFFRWEATLAAVAHRYKYDYIGTTKQKFSFVPELNLSLNFSAFHTLTLTFEKKSNLLDETFFLATPQQMSYRERRLGTMIDRPYSKEKEVSLSYFWLNIYNQNNLIVNLRYTRNENDIMSKVEMKGDQVETTSIGNGTSDNFYGYMHYRQGLVFVPIDAQVSLNGSLTKAPNWVNNEIYTSNFRNMSEEISFTSRFKSPWNFAMSVKFNQSFSKINNGSFSSKLHTWDCKGEIFYAKKKFNGSIYAAYVDLDNVLYKDQYVDLGLNLRYNLKKFTLSLQGVNLLNLGENESVSVGNGSYYTYRTIYRKTPGYLLLGLTYQF